MSLSPLIRITAGTPRNPEWRMACPVDFEMLPGEHIAVCGPNGAGKSMFIDMVTGAHPLLHNQAAYCFGPNASNMVSDNIRHITFRDTYGGDNDRTFFLQQRWNATEIDSETPTAGQLLDRELALLSKQPDGQSQNFKDNLCRLFGLEPVLGKYIILLSSGELRKFHLAKALLSRPRLLIIDNPFIGLDTTARGQLRHILELLSKEDIQMLLVVSDETEIPDFITHVVPVENMTVGEKVTRGHFFSHIDSPGEEVPCNLQIPDSSSFALHTPLLEMNDITVRYGSHTILSHLSWTIRCGERWALKGRNGSGKSTLLSLICADNPQAYACDISIFGKKRGSGESIWDIKKHIGYVSPEMHRACRVNIPAVSIVASGFFDTTGLYSHPSADQLLSARRWLSIFGIGHVADRPFLRLSSGEQRLVLLARAFVKEPQLLILDEPMHGLDPRNQRLVKEIVTGYCQSPEKTLIFVTHDDRQLPPVITHRLEL